MKVGEWTMRASGSMDCVLKTWSQVIMYCLHECLGFDLGSALMERRVGILKGVKNSVFSHYFLETSKAQLERKQFIPHWQPYKHKLRTQTQRMNSSHGENWFQCQCLWRHLLSSDTFAGPLFCECVRIEEAKIEARRDFRRSSQCR